MRSTVGRRGRAHAPPIAHARVHARQQGRLRAIHRGRREVGRVRRAHGRGRHVGGEHGAPGRVAGVHDKHMRPPGWTTTVGDRQLPNRRQVLPRNLRRRRPLQLGRTNQHQMVPTGIEPGHKRIPGSERADIAHQGTRRRRGTWLAGLKGKRAGRRERSRLKKWRGCEETKSAGGEFILILYGQLV